MLPPKYTKFMHLDKNHFDIAIPVIENDAIEIENPETVVEKIEEVIKQYLEHPEVFPCTPDCDFSMQNDGVFIGYRTRVLRELDWVALYLKLMGLGYKIVPDVNSYKEYQKYKWEAKE